MVGYTEKQLVEELGKVPLFANASKKQLKTLANAGKVLTWPEGKVGVVQGSSAAAFFLILSGSVEVTRDGKPLARLNDNDYFGEAAMLTGNPRNAQVAATSETVLFALGRTAFARTVKHDGDLAMKVLATMSERLASMI
ncbi:MAG: cyclic nucleotide-binding domain-containing protein [Acidimicrobiia bacterium]|nr:cyclic nucleotide-binding domain-containing protein [Acidimicrobiia bacterium]